MTTTTVRKRQKSKRLRIRARSAAPKAWGNGLPKKRACRKCGCTDNDCSQCVERTGFACSWVSPDLCSACA